MTWEQYGPANRRWQHRFLETFVAELNAQRSVNVPENAYWLLWTNVQAVLSRL